MPRSGPDPDVLRQKVQFVRDTLRRLEGVRASGRADFLDDPILQAAATRFLQIGVEAILDAANHVIAREGLGLPKTYQEAVEILIREGILPRERSEDLIRMVRFRNRAVHLYDDIDPGEIWSIIDGHLDDFEVFVRAMAERYF